MSKKRKKKKKQKKKKKKRRRRGNPKLPLWADQNSVQYGSPM